MKNLMPRITGLLLLIILLVNCSDHSAMDYALVTDNENLLTEAQRDKLRALYSAHEKKTSNEIALVTVADYGTDSTILFYSVGIANQLGIGKKGKDNGVLIAVSKANRETFIATGYGTEKVLKDHIAKKIIDSLMVPEFKKGNYYEAIYEGSKAIITFLEQPGHEIK